MPSCRAVRREIQQIRQHDHLTVRRRQGGQRLGDHHPVDNPARGVGPRINLDLGLLRDLGYYTGAILEVYDPALGHVLGGGGRYDELMGRFGRPLPAAGFALYLERVHVAQAEEERLTTTGAREEGL